MRGFQYKKSVQALNFLAIKAGGTLNKMKAIKLIWLADRLHLRKYARTITGDFYFALPNGPVASSTRDILKHYESLSKTELEYADEYIQPKDKYFFVSIKACNTKVCSQTDMEVLELIWLKYGRLSEFELVELSHVFPEWIKYQSAFERHTITRANIDLLDFFVAYDDGKGVFVADEATVADSLALYQEKRIHTSF